MVTKRVEEHYFLLQIKELYALYFKIDSQIIQKVDGLTTFVCKSWCCFFTVLICSLEF
jgi:hypothetical protein